MSAGEGFLLKNKYLFWGVIFALLVVFFIKIQEVLLPFYISIFVMVLFSGIVGKLNKKFHIPRAVSAGIITILVCLFFFYCIYALCNLSFTKATYSVKNIKNNTELINTTVGYFEAILKKFDIENNFNLIAGQFADVVMNYANNVIGYIFNYSANIISTICLIALSPIVMFMMLKDAPIIVKKFYILLPKNIQKEAKKLANDMHESVFRFLEGQTLAAIILSVCYSILLFFIGSEHFLLLGIIIGFSSFIPYLGFYSATAITLFSIYSQFHDLKQTIVTLLILLAMQIIDCGFITPKVVGSKLGVHPLLIIFGVLVSAPLFGFFGVLLILPIIGIISVVAKFFFKKYRESSYYK